MATWGECAHPAPLHPAPLGSLASRSPMQNAWTLTPLRQVLLHSSSSRVSFRKKVHKMSSYCVREGNILLLFCLVIIEQSLLSFLSLFFWRKNFYILQLCMTTSTRRVGLLNWKAVQYFVLRKQQHRHTLFLVRAHGDRVENPYREPIWSVCDLHNIRIQMLKTGLFTIQSAWNVTNHWRETNNEWQVVWNIQEILIVFGVPSFEFHPEYQNISQEKKDFFTNWSF